MADTKYVDNDIKIASGTGREAVQKKVDGIAGYVEDARKGHLYEIRNKRQDSR